MQLWHWEEQRNEEVEEPTSIGNPIISYCRWSSSVETEAGEVSDLCGVTWFTVALDPDLFELVYCAMFKWKLRIYFHIRCAQVGLGVSHLILGDYPVH